MGEMIYKFKPGASLSGVSSQVAGEELERIRVAHNGRLVAQDVVAEAQDESSPIHPVFEWDDTLAAKQHRLNQASYMIRAVVVMVKEPDKEEPSPPVRAFVLVDRDEDRSYTSVVHAMSDAELRVQILQRAWSELVSWRNRYNELLEFANVVAVIDQIPKPDFGEAQLRRVK